MLTKIYLSVVLTLLAGPLSAATIIEHVGNNDPTTESPPWTFVTGGSPTTGGGTEVGVDYWQVSATNADGQYRTVPSDSQLTHAWRYTGIFRVDSTNISQARVGLNFLDGASYFRIGIDSSGQVVYQTPAGAKQSYTVPVGFDSTCYNQYTLTMTPTTPGMTSSTDVIQFYLNGVLQQTLARSDFPTHTAKVFTWGSAASSGQYDARFNLVGFYDSDAAPPNYTPVCVPEPQGLLLALAGGLLVFRNRN